MDLIQDVRYAVRRFRRNPGFTVAVVTLALGNGANTSVFTVLNGILLKMLPVKDPPQLAVIGDPPRASSRSNGTPRTDVFSYPLYKEIRDHNSVFNGLSAGATDHHIEVDSGNSQFPDQKITGRMVSGNPLSLASKRVLHSYLFGLKGTDPLSLIAVVVLLGVVAALAGFIPARRAAGVDPTVALRYE
jgi:ABC-type antimicrobial peptide transport system permease subunit